MRIEPRIEPRPLPRAVALVAHDAILEDPGFHIGLPDDAAEADELTVLVTQIEEHVEEMRVRVVDA